MVFLYCVIIAGTMKLNKWAQMALTTARHMWSYNKNTLEPFKGCQGDPKGVLEVFRGPKLNPTNIVHV